MERVLANIMPIVASADGAVWPGMGCALAQVLEDMESTDREIARGAVGCDILQRNLRDVVP
jgi:hypothetical protein